MTQQGGDRAYPDGDAITVKNTSGSTINAGQVVSINGYDGDHPEVGLADVSGAGDIVGVAKNDVADGETVAVQLRGAVWTRIDSAAVAGDEVATPDSANAGESAGVAEVGGAMGHYVLADAVQKPDGNYYAPVLLD